MRGKLIWWTVALLLMSAAPATANQGRVAGLQQKGDTALLTVERARVAWQSSGTGLPEQVDWSGRSIQAGDQVSTDGLGRARLSLAPDAAATLYHDTVLTMVDVPNRRVQLEEGTLVLQASDQGAPVVIETADGSVEVRGRALVHRLVDRRRNHASTWVVVQDGQAQVGGGGSQVTLTGSQQSWIENGGQPQQPLDAQRDVVGNQFYLIDDLTNGAIMDEELLASRPTAAPSFPLGLVLGLAVVVILGGLILVATRAGSSRAALDRVAQPDPLAAVSAASLLVEGGDGRPIPITGGLSIGRSPDNRLPVVDSMVSSHHARIFAQDGEYLIEDLSSRNGTLVNGQRVTSQRLQSGDQIRIGHMTFLFQRAGAPAPTADVWPRAAGLPHAGVQLAEGKLIAMRGAVLAIGRASDNQVILADPLASAHHARLVAEPGGVVIEDLDSTNGTFVNGQRVTRQLLAPGDRIGVGQAELVFRMEVGQEGAT